MANLSSSKKEKNYEPMLQYGTTYPIPLPIDFNSRLYYKNEYRKRMCEHHYYSIY